MLNRPFGVLGLLAILVVISGCQPRFRPEAVAYLDDSIITELLDQKKEAIKSGDTLRWMGFFADDVILENISPSKTTKLSGRGLIFEEMSPFINKIKSYDSQILDQIIMIGKDRQSAVVIRRSKDVWIFDGSYNDLSMDLDQYIEWRLIDGVPLITRIFRRFDLSIINKDERPYTAGFSGKKYP